MRSRDDSLYVSMLRRGMSRRTFLRFTAAMTTALALPMSYAPRVAAALTSAPRLPVVWLHGQACGGDTRALFQATKPTTAELFLDLLSVEYHETSMAPVGAAAEGRRNDVLATSPGAYLAVVEGAIPMGDGGVFCTVGGRAFSDIARDVCSGAAATIAVGSCAFDGGIAAAGGGTTGAAGVEAIVPDATLINLPGCPLNVENLTATIVHYLTFGTMPVTDARGRPLFAYGGLIHNQCERRAHFEFGEFVQSWGDEGAQKGWCLYKMGCKGPEADANCPTVRYASETSWPVRAGHGCIGCTSAGFWDAMGPAYQRLPDPLPFAPQISPDQLGLAMVGGVAVVTAAHGAASSVRLRRWGAETRRARVAAVVGGGAAAIDDAPAPETAIDEREADDVDAVPMPAVAATDDAVPTPAVAATEIETDDVDIDAPDADAAMPADDDLDRAVAEAPLAPIEPDAPDDADAPVDAAAPDDGPEPPR